MSRYSSASPVALVVPFHNEQRHLPLLLTSLRAQRDHTVPVIFVDNGSTDRSRSLLDGCEEIARGTWLCIDEPRVGKFHAMKAGTRFCAERFGAEYITFLDADSYCANDDWLRMTSRAVSDAPHRLGYTYSPFRYHSYEHLPVFARAYAAYERVLIHLVEGIGWLANGQAFAAPSVTLQRYFDTAQITSEIDLRISLLALAEGRRGYLVPRVIMTSPRRIFVNAHNFTAWCFYGADFYSRKDINLSAKLNLDAPDAVNDLPPSLVGHFFARRALKLVCRHLLPLAIFDSTRITQARLGAALGIELEPQVLAAFAQFTATTDYLFTPRFEAMVEAIEQHAFAAAVATCIARLMQAEYGARVPDQIRDASATAMR